MTPEEAIKMLEMLAAHDEVSGRPEYARAEKLGTEALKLLVSYREWRGAIPNSLETEWHRANADALLPGETEE